MLQRLTVSGATFTFNFGLCQDLRFLSGELIALKTRKSPELVLGKVPVFK